jgi:hypothetical protein
MVSTFYMTNQSIDGVFIAYDAIKKIAFNRHTVTLTIMLHLPHQPQALG